MLCLIWYIVIFFFATDFSIDSFIDQHVVKLQNPSLYDTFLFFDSTPTSPNDQHVENLPDTTPHPLSAVFLFDSVPSSPDRFRLRSPPYASPSLSSSMPPSFPFAFGLSDLTISPHTMPAESTAVKPIERHVCLESDDEDFRHDNRHVCVDLESQASPLDSSDSYQGALDKRWKTHLSRHVCVDPESQASPLDSSDSYQGALDNTRGPTPITFPTTHFPSQLCSYYQVNRRTDE